MNARLRWLMTGSRSDRRTVRGSLRLLHPAWGCVIAAIALSLLGVYAIDLTSSGASHVSGELSPQAWKQVVFLVVGMLAGTVSVLPHVRWLSALSWFIAAGTLALLVLLLMPGIPESLVSPINGTRAWIKLPGFNAQPSELAKIAFVLLVATLLKRSDAHRTLVGIARLFLLVAVPVGLIALQPDLGTASLFVPSLVAMLIAAGARLGHLALLAALGLAVTPLAWPLMHDYQQERIVALVRQLQGDRSGGQDENFQSFTAQRLIGAGGLTGMPDDRARALVRFNRLPEAHNDMIPAVVMCRFGVVGGVLMGLGYGLWIGCALLTAAMTKDAFGRLIPVGLCGFIACQAVVNVGMNVGLLPIIGITLPFVSYGGSSLLTCWIMTGLIVNVAMRKPTPPIRASFEYDETDDAVKR